MVDYNKYDWNIISRVIDYILYESWKLPYQAWQMTPSWLKIGIEILFVVLCLVIGYFTWKKRHDWMYVHGSSVYK